MVNTALLERLDAAWSSSMELLFEVIVPSPTFSVPENSAVLPEKSNMAPLPSVKPCGYDKVPPVELSLPSARFSTEAD